VAGSGTVYLVVGEQSEHAHPSPAGAFLELDFRHKATYLGPHSRAVIHRDLGTSFALPALGEHDAFCETTRDTTSRLLCGAGFKDVGHRLVHVYWIILTR
jgi:hypothetical protein